MNPIATIETSKGTIKLELWPDKAPNHVENFIKLVKKGFYDDLVFHRVIPEFMIQTGCPQGTGSGGPGYTIDAEFNSGTFETGVLGMARSAHPNSAGSQFFICVAPVSHLNGSYTAFGKVLEGQEVADEISLVECGNRNRPREDVKMLKVTVEEGEAS